MNIHGIVLVVVGTGMALMSWLINSARDTSDLLIFIISGIGIAAYGLGKFIIIDLKESEKKKLLKGQNQNNHNNTQNNQTINSFQGQNQQVNSSINQNSQQQNIHQKQIYGNQTGYCHSCKAPKQQHFIFCPRCGIRVM